MSANPTRATRSCSEPTWLRGSSDPYTPTAPSLIARRFNFDRELPEARVEAMLEQIVGSPLVPRVAKLIETRLDRPLEPFDIWYNGFLPRGKYTEAELDAITKKKYPTSAAFAADIPAILVKLGFSEERARYLASNIEVDPSRGAGHAWGAQRRGDKAHLRTRVGADGMDYKGYNIAVHELGHNVEQTFSLDEVPYNALEGVPNTAFTEALAFVFQARDLELLGPRQARCDSEALRCSTTSGGPTRSAASALIGHARLALDVRASGSDAGGAARRRRSASPATYGTASTRRYSGVATSCCSGSTRT